jgi:hypothetical protein
LTPVEIDSDIELDPEREAAILAGLTAMGVPGTPVVVARDFAKEIGNLTLEYEYTSDRIGGYVGGKTIRTSTGALAIVLNARAVEELDPPGVERIAAHEAGHVLIDQNHEDISWEDTAQFRPIHWQRLLTYVAANAIDEFRVERAVMGLGYEVHHDATATEFGDALMDANAGMLEAVLRFRESDDVLAMRDRALEGLDRFSKRLAHLVASQPFAPFDPALLDSAARANWEAIVGPVWDQHVAYYTAIPDARTRWERTQVESTVKHGGDLAGFLLRALGFEFRGGDDDESFWQIRDEHELERAFRRYQADVELRGE